MLYVEVEVGRGKRDSLSRGSRADLFRREEPWHRYLLCIQNTSSGPSESPHSTVESEV